MGTFMTFAARSPLGCRSSALACRLLRPCSVTLAEVALALSESYQRHTYDAEKRAALEAWGAHVMALVEGSKPGKVLPMRGKV